MSANPAESGSEPDVDVLDRAEADDSPDSPDGSDSLDPGPAPHGAGVPAPRTPSPRAGELVRRVRVGRQAIYDANRQIVSYALQFRSDGDGADGLGEQTTSQVIASTFGTFGLEAISDGRPVFINFTRAFITGVITLPVEPDNVIVEVGEHVAVDQELLLGLGSLRQAGYRIAVHNYRGDSGHSALLELADFASIDVNSQSPLTIPGLVAAARAGGATLLAGNIEDAQTFQYCQSLGFDLFQGPHLQRETVLESRALSPSQLVCVRLLNELADPEVPVHRVEHLVGSDPGLTMRLLRTANSAQSGARTEVTSLRQAIVLIGPRRLRSWLVLTLLEGGTTRNRSDDLWSVLARAHACERLAVHDADVAFTVGLLAGCADLLGIDRSAVADGSGVGEQARHALVDGEGEAGRALVAVLAHERDDADGIARTGLAPFDVSRAYLESLSESLSLVHELIGD